jgi:hypothetical protein
LATLLFAPARPVPLALDIGEYHSAGSWALGVVVPEVAPSATGGGASWETVNNVTITMKLPDIRQTDGTTYAILSLMANDGSILQLAAGLLPNASAWGTYAMWIQNPSSYPQQYRTVLNASTPGFAIGTNVSLEMYLAGGKWAFLARAVGTNLTVRSILSQDLSTSLRGGDQEVFALESYSFDSDVFADMGNLTLSSILLNGHKVTSGIYFYNGGWNPSHSPLFAVGGATPPGFILISSCDGNVACWSFRSLWSGPPGSPVAQGMTIAVIGVALVAAGIAVSAAVLERRRQA